MLVITLVYLTLSKEISMSNKRCNECGASNVVIGEYCDLCAPHMVGHVVEADDSISLNNKEYIMSELGYGNAWDLAVDAVSTYDHVKYDDQGTEIGASEVLTPMLQGVSVITEWVEDNAIPLGDRLGDAELMTQSFSEVVYEEDFDDVVRGIPSETLYVSKEAHMYITYEQQCLNYEFYISKLDQAKTLYELGLVKNTVTGARKKTGGEFFFPVRYAEQFMAHYSALTLKFLERRIFSAKRAGELKSLKAEVYSANISFDDRKRLFSTCDALIAKLSA